MSPAATEAASPELLQLFDTLKTTLGGSTLGAARWYVLALSTIVGAGEPLAAGHFYRYLLSLAEFSTHASRQTLMRRLRETLLKSVAIVGIGKPLEAIMAIDKATAPEDRERSFSREHWTSGRENHERGVAWLSTLYQHNLQSTMALFADQRDFGWLVEDIIYGLFLSDRQILDDVDTELILVSSLMVQNLPQETWWHMRGARRVGVSRDDLQVVWDCIHVVGRFTGIRLDRVPTPAEVEKDV